MRLNIWPPSRKRYHNPLVQLLSSPGNPVARLKDWPVGKWPALLGLSVDILDADPEV